MVLNKGEGKVWLVDKELVEIEIIFVGCVFNSVFRGFILGVSWGISMC